MGLKLKNSSIILITIALLLLLAACGKSAEERWQEQYDLGQKYLTELNYEQAIIAFTNAINIDPNMADAYIGRGDTYAAIAADSADKDLENENLQYAQSDYEQSLLYADMTFAVFEKLANVYTLQNDTKALSDLVESAVDILGQQADFQNWLDENGYGIAPDGSAYSTEEEKELNQILQETNYRYGYDGDGVTNYLSSAERERIIRPLIERYIAAIENNPGKLRDYGDCIIRFYYLLGELENVKTWREKLYRSTGYEEYSPEYSRVGSATSNAGISYDIYYYYDEYGRCIREEEPHGNHIISENGPTYYSSTVTRTYDENGRLIHLDRDIYYEDGSYQIQDIEITYGEDGRIASKRWDSDVGILFFSWNSVFSYGDNTVTIVETHLENGEVRYINENVYSLNEYGYITE